jgi:hypothetical protein
MNWYHKEITLNTLGAGTIDIMEWIRDNGCPNLDCTIFKDARGNDVAKVSLGNESMFPEFLEDIKEGHEKWFEYEGMKRCQSRFVKGLWIFLINGDYYWATR